MRVWVFANQKGGVGKTTLCVGVADCLVEKGYKVLIIDLDPQCSLTVYASVDPEQSSCSSVQFFDESSERVKPIEVFNKRIDLVPGSLQLAVVEKKMADKAGAGSYLKRAMKQFSDYDFILIDTAPTLGLLLINALAVSEHLCVPVQTEYLAVQGLQRMQRTLSMVGRSLGYEVPYTIVPNLYDKRTRASRDTLLSLRTEYVEHLWAAMVPVDTRFRDAQQRKKMPTQIGMDERGFRALNSLTQFLLNKSAKKTEMVHPKNIDDSASVAKL